MVIVCYCFYCNSAKSFLHYEQMLNKSNVMEVVQGKAKKVAPPPRGLIIVDKCSRAGGAWSSCERWPVHSFVLAFTVVQLRDVFTVLCQHNAHPTALSTSPDPAPPPSIH